MTRRQRLVATAATAACVASVATAASPGGVVGQGSTADTTITLRATGSTLEFQPPRIAAKNGTRVRLRFVNGGTLPHNVVLPRDDGDIDGLALAAYDAAESGYVPMDQKDRLLAYSALASPGDTVELTFVVPPPGDYTYICLFPGHANSMFGTLRALR